jgi:hypothetical protein
MELREKETPAVVDNAPPRYLLANEQTTESLEDDVLEYRLFTTKLEMVTYLSNVTNRLRQSKIMSSERWERLWDSMALMYFDSICQRTIRSGVEVWKVNEPGRYLFGASKKGNNRSVLYRHHIYGPINLYQLAGSTIDKLFQALPPYKHSEIEENFGYRQYLMGNKGIIELWLEFYTDKDGKEINKKIKGEEKHYEDEGKTQPVQGSVARFITVFSQISRTFDLYEVPREELLHLLPQEFSYLLQNKKF